MTDNIDAVKYFTTKILGVTRPVGVLEIEKALNPCNFSKIEQDAKKARTQDWSERDGLPTGDPIGDVDETGKALEIEELDLSKLKKVTFNTKYMKFPVKFIRDQEMYHKSLKEKGIDNNNKFFGVDMAQCCAHPDKYKNIISNSLKFWSCKNCGADLGDIND